MLRTRLPLTRLGIATKTNPLDLHALDTPPAFILSQDQTLSRTLSDPSWFGGINHFFYLQDCALKDLDPIQFAPRRV